MEAQKQLYKIFKRLIFVLLIVVVLGSVVSIFIQKWLEYHIVDIINADEDRAYDISYESLDLDPSFRGFKLEQVRIQPLNKYQGSIINCQVNRIAVSGLNWRELMLKGQANISDISFISPKFDLTIAESDTEKANSSKQFQLFFGDVLSRVQLNNFSLVDGSFVLYAQDEERNELGHVGRINFQANDIETDSLQWENLIPFKLGEWSSSLEDFFFKIDEHTVLECAAINYNPKQSSICISGIAIQLNKTRDEVARLKGIQSDIIEITLQSLTINEIGANSDLYGALDIRSKSLIIDQLELKAYKNKNLPLGTEVEKPLFSDMIALIPFDLKVDTILIKNTNVAYTELGKGRSEEGTITLSDLDGSIYGFTTLDSLQTVYKYFDLSVKGKLNNGGRLFVNLNVPYNSNSFHLKAKLKAFNMQQLNTTIKPMLGIVVESGNLSTLDFDMRANRQYSKSEMVLNYTDLKLTVLDTNSNYNKRRGLISGLANTLIRERNKPKEKNYIIANYKTERNIYRGPFNFLWFALQDGIKEIVPTTMAKELMEYEGSSSKHKKQRKSK